ncbi:MAG: TolA protein [Myxococcaceae bacterium]|nr:TolA protein [Myxococcaceae bacterium]
MADTRKDKRAPVSLKVRFKSATVDEFIEHYSKDVSRGGIYIKSSQPMPVGTLLKFQFQLKDESALIRGVGRVVWTRIEEDALAEAPAGMGIKFIKMDNESRAMVERIVDSHADERGTYESGRYNATSAEPSSSPPPKDGGSFFPDLPPAELPLPEDRTAVRQATEFLAAALTEGGTDEVAAREAQTKADEARRRTEEVEAQRRDEAESKKKLEAEARASLRPKPIEPEPAEQPSEPEPDDDNEPTPRSLPSMIIDPSLEPRAGRASEQTPGSDVTPLPRTNEALLALTRRNTDTPEPDTEPPPPLEEPRSPTTSIPFTAEAPKRSLLPWLAIAAVLLVAAIVFFRGSDTARPGGESIAADKAPSQDETVRELQAAPTPSPTPAPIADVPGVVEAPTAAAEPQAAADADVPEELAPQVGVALVAVEVSTSPRGAEVWVGDEKRGPAPQSLKLPSGVPVVVRATAPGHSEAREELTPSKRTKLALQLQPFPYVVRVESTPPGAEVTIGAHKGATPVELTLDPPPTGQLAVNAKLEGYEGAKTRLKLDQFVETDGAMRAQLSLTLQPSLPKQTGKEAAAAPSLKERPQKAAPKKPPTSGEAPAPAAIGDAPAAEPTQLELKPVEPPPAEPKPVEPPPAEPPSAEKPAPLPDNPFQ